MVADFRDKFHSPGPWSYTPLLLQYTMSADMNDNLMEGIVEPPSVQKATRIPSWKRELMANGVPLPGEVIPRIYVSETYTVLEIKCTSGQINTWRLA
jgi:hypothetical protein